ncbi:zinc-binding alcohol dehydrogenase family protein [Sphingomonas sp. BK580]|uniref:quinone oxidoreductase family protein n=1 Tax=Sphingomonas sp. BK580 TaxID=2586972 RepID=UPI001615E711|nr:zinc-binding alcohol dehydrogenase family protein [Sphingomonas sp. BK580]MBB3695219.1 NADPH2:quinone reductase [Sphingomonas sp. BK580]
MKALLLDRPDAPAKVADSPKPAGRDGLPSFRVRAAALTNLDVMIARGAHYLSPSQWPRGVGREAVAEDAAGRRFYLTAPAIPTPLGSMAEWTLADPSRALPVPEGISDEVAAAIGNPGLAAWLALSWRGRLRVGESVLILGATGASGRIAVAAASILGAGRIVAVGRNQAMLDRLEGADLTFALQPDETALTNFLLGGFAQGFDVVIDYLNGSIAEAALPSLALGGRMVQVGSAAGPSMILPAQPMRRHSLDVLGFAYYHAPIELQAEAYTGLCVAAMGGLIDLDYRKTSLGQAPQAWDSQTRGGGPRWVVCPGLCRESAE